MERVDDLLDLLSENNFLDVMNALVHVFGTWSQRHIAAQGTESRVHEAFSTLAGTVYTTAKQVPSHRKKWPDGKDLPHADKDPRVRDMISGQILRHMGSLSFESGLSFLGQLWGQWLLVCPLETWGDPAAMGSDDDEVIEHMLRWLDLYESM
jgi:hypothetical protein